jgi:hypothetical protein
MDAALKTMFALRQTRDLDMAALKDSSLGHREVRKAAGTFGNRGLSVIESVYKAATELRHFGEGVGFAALVDYAKNGSLLEAECVGFEVPARIRTANVALANIKQPASKPNFARGRIVRVLILFLLPGSANFPGLIPVLGLI